MGQLMNDLELWAGWVPRTDIVLGVHPIASRSAGSAGAADLEAIGCQSWFGYQTHPRWISPNFLIIPFFIPRSSPLLKSEDCGDKERYSS